MPTPAPSLLFTVNYADRRYMMVSVAREDLAGDRAAQIYFESSARRLRA